MDRVIAWDARGQNHYCKSRNSSDLAGGESYILRAFMSAYHVTKDPYWLRRMSMHTDSLISVSWDFPDTGAYNACYADGFLGWGTRDYSDQYDEYMVHEAHVTTPIAELVAEVYKDSTLWPEFGDRAQTYFAFLADQIAAKWLRLWPGTPPATFRWGQTIREWGGLGYIPNNQYAAFASMLLFLDDVVRTPRYGGLHPGEPPSIYRARAVEMGEYFKRRLTLVPVNDAYLWKYHDTSSGSEDASHANLELELAWYLNERGLVFADLEMHRFARTLTGIMWNKSLTSPAVNYSVGGAGDWSGTDYMWGWSLYGKFDPLLWRVLERYYAGKTNDASPYGIATAARLQRFRDTFLSRGIIVPERLLVIDDGDQVIRPGETATIGVLVRNIGNARDSIAVRIAGFASLVMISGSDSAIVAVDSGGTALAEFQVRAPLDVVTRRVSVTAFVGFLSSTINVTIGFPSAVFIEGTPPQDGVTHNAFYGLLTPVPHRLICADGETLTTATLLRFESVIWRAAWAIPTVQQRDTLAKFMDMGGNLLITGGGVLPEWANRSLEDSVFFARYFKVTGATDVRDSLAGLGASVRPFNPVALTAMGTSQRFLRTSPVVHFDVLRSFAPQNAQVIFAATDAQLKPKVLPDSVGGVGIDSTYNALLFGWDLDDMAPNTTRTVLTYALAWFKSPTSVDLNDTVGPTLAGHIEITAAPNPFNPQTTITARGLTPGVTARLQVTNALGQRCWSEKNTRPGSEWTVRWDGRNAEGRYFGTGTYLVTIEQGATRKTARIQLLR
jgi:hypothetical protein